MGLGKEESDMGCLLDEAERLLTGMKYRRTYDESDVQQAHLASPRYQSPQMLRNKQEWPGRGGQQGNLTKFVVRKGGMKDGRKKQEALLHKNSTVARKIAEAIGAAADLNTTALV
eukprot:Hpha_TRINITY_DN7685_c0_g1::TRINITY_DN7685_c0_g1_i1::g.19347::m.19347